MPKTIEIDADKASLVAAALYDRSNKLEEYIRSYGEISSEVRAAWESNRDYLRSLARKLMA